MERAKEFSSPRQIKNRCECDQSPNPKPKHFDRLSPVKPVPIFTKQIPAASSFSFTLPVFSFQTTLPPPPSPPLRLIFSKASQRKNQILIEEARRVFLLIRRPIQLVLNPASRVLYALISQIRYDIFHAFALLQLLYPSVWLPRKQLGRTKKKFNSGSCCSLLL